VAVADFTTWYRWISSDPLVFAEQAMRCDGEHNPRLTYQQKRLLRAVQAETMMPVSQRKKRIAVKSGQGTGKTTCEVILALWRAFYSVDALVVLTAPTQNQIKDVWFAEARRLLINAHPVIKEMCDVSSMRVRIGKRKDWGIVGKAASKPENFQGFHQKYLTIIVDEASGVDREIMRTIKGTLTNEDSLLVLAGNPNTRECAFFDVFHSRRESEFWHLFTFNAEDSPITDKENIRRIAAEFGVNSDVYRVRVLGEFPLAEANAVMSRDDLEVCTEIPMIQAAKMRGTLRYDKAFGIDFARYGSDESVIYRRSGLAIVEKAIFAHTEPIEVLNEAFKMQQRAGWSDKDCIYVVDAGGMGQGVLGYLYQHRKRVHEFQSNHKASQPDYADKITEAYFHVARLAKQRKLHIPADEHLLLQLCSRLYETDGKTKLKLESKDKFMRRMEGQSPDRADALVMAYFDAVSARGAVG
jgi:phage terminase large subunit